MHRGLQAETGPEAVAADPDGHRIALENAYVRVLELRAEPGPRIPLHVHPPHTVAVLSGARIRVIRRDGTSELIDLKPGDVSWSETEEHSMEVVAGILHEIDTEIKEACRHRSYLQPKMSPKSRRN